MHARQAVSGQNPENAKNSTYQAENSCTYDHTRHNMVSTIISTRKQLPLPGFPALKPELVSVPRSKTSSSLVRTRHTVSPFQLLYAVRPHQNPFAKVPSQFPGLSLSNYTYSLSLTPLLSALYTPHENYIKNGLKGIHYLFTEYFQPSGLPLLTTRVPTLSCSC